MPMDPRDRLILALSALLGAEREARHAMEEAIRSGALTGETAAALTGRGIVVPDAEDIVLAEEFSRPYHRTPAMAS